jgi:aldehyde dehydrogenase (NAD+)
MDTQMGGSPKIGPTTAHLDRLFIGGAWVKSNDGGVLEVVSPNTEQIVARTAAAGPADMDRAVLAARKAFDEGPWPRTPPAERARILRRLGEALQSRHEDIGAAWMMQMGGLPSIAPLMGILGTANVMNTAEVGEAFAFEETVKSGIAPHGILVHEAVGVVAAIAPWNAPYMLMTNKIAPALMAGCSVIMKPSPETPLEAYIIAECAEKIGLPEGVLNLVPADREAADHLISNPGVDKVSFTGSTAVGRRIQSVCGARMARCTLELGGKSAAIVLDDFAIQDAAQLLVGTITLMSGQICSMLSRAIVPRSRHDALAQAIADQMRSIRVGYSDAPDTQMGPLASKRQLERVQKYVENGKAGRATLATGGSRPSNLSRGYFLEPTLFVNVDNRSTIAQEEIFGPVLSLIPCEDVDDAVRIANDSIYGLHGSVLTHDANAAYRVGRRVRAGSFAQNGMKTDFGLPHGGFKQSGVGREGAAEGLKAYLETKAMLFDSVPTHTADG